MEWIHEKKCKMDRAGSAAPKTTTEVVCAYRAAALEYLETILPRAVRERLWSFLEPGESTAHTEKSQEIALTDLRRLHESVEISLAELERRGMLRPEDPPE